jgi:hypothetical protein
MMATTKVVDIIDRASIILQDISHVRFPEEELLKFFNDAQKEVVLLRPDSNMQNATMTCVAGSKQTIPATGLRLVNIIRNDGGRAITQVDRKILDETLPDWHQSVADVTRKIENFVFDPADPKHFYVYPAATDSFVLEILYSSPPASISISNFASDTSVISLDDIYANCLLDYVLYRSYQKDSEFAGNAQKAAMHYQGFSSSLGSKTQIDGALTPTPSTPDANQGRG